MDANALIRFDVVSRTYPRGCVRAMRDVSLHIHCGDYVAITGPSGSGKSTLLYLASGLDRPDSGTVYFDGAAPSTLAQWTRLRSRRIGFVFQNFQLIPGLTALENIELPMLGTLTGSLNRRRRAAWLLDRVGLAPRARHRAGDLSGGEVQRVAIARALANSPSVLLADEPTGNLDSRTAGEIISLLEELNLSDHVTLVLVTHDERLAQRASRIIGLKDGHIVADLCGAPA